MIRSLLSRAANFVQALKAEREVFRPHIREAKNPGNPPPRPEPTPAPPPVKTGYSSKIEVNTTNDKITILVNGKSVDPASKEGKKILADMGRVNGACDKVGKEAVDLGKIVEDAFRGAPKLPK